MASTTVGIKLDEETRERLRNLGAEKDRSPHWLMKAAIGEYLDREERRERERREDAERWERYVETGAHLSDDSMSKWMDGLQKKAEKRAQGRR